jgi:hypothetical protein
MATGSTLDDLLREAWYRGRLRRFTRPHRQRDFYDAIKGWKARNPSRFGPVLGNCHRRMGKSFCLTLIAWERCLAKPDHYAWFDTPDYENGRAYLRDLYGKIHAICPPDLRPQVAGRDLIFRNPAWGPGAPPSILRHGAVRQPDSLRGARANTIILDECREMNDLPYIIRDVLAPQFLRQEDPLLVLSSSPPKSMAHPFVTEYIPAAMQRGAYFLAPAEARDGQPGNPDLSEADKEMLLEEYGGRESIAWRREMLCELVSDPEALVVPEFGPLRDRLVLRRERPAYFDAYVGIDFGWQDYNGVLYAYLDFLQRKLHVEAEVWLHNASTGQLAAAMKETERRIYGLEHRRRKDPGSTDDQGRHWRYRSIFRCGDHSMQQLYDLQFDHDLLVVEADKWDRDAALANLRDGIRREQVTFDPACTHVIHQLEHGMWKETLDGARRDFKRDNVLGHLDLLAALIYLYRKVSWTENPAPRPTHRPSTEWPSVEPDGEAGLDFEPLDLDFEPLS